MVQGGPKDPPYAPPDQERKRGRAEEHEELSGLEEEEEDAAAQAEGAAQDIMAPDEEAPPRQRGRNSRKVRAELTVPHDTLVCILGLCWPKKSASLGASCTPSRVPGEASAAMTSMSCAPAEAAASRADGGRHGPGRCGPLHSLPARDAMPSDRRLHKHSETLTKAV